MLESVHLNYSYYQTSLNGLQTTTEESEVNVSEIYQTTGIVGGNFTNFDHEIENMWLWTFIDGVLMLAILCGNILTILAVTLSRRLSSLISNQFVLNLAISDLMVGLTLPYHLAFYLNENLGNEKSTCVLRFILITLACCASILNLIAIAVDRYIAILHPLHYSRYMSKKATRTLMVVGWVLAVTVSVVPIFWNNWGMANSCDMHKVIPKEYTTNILAPMFSLIWVVMFVLYWRIWREAALHARRMRTTTCSAGPNDWKSVQVVLMVLGSFSICWMPYVVVVCTQTMKVYNTQNQLLYKAVFSLAMANSGINPIIYAWKNTGFRRAFLRLLRCQSPDTPEFERSFRNNTTNVPISRKMPMDTMVKNDPPPVIKEQESNVNNCNKDANNKNATDNKEESKPNNANAVDNPINNNSVKSDRCRIIENIIYDDRLLMDVEKCHIIENLGFEDCLNINNLRMIDSAEKDSDEESVATLPMSQENVKNKTLNSLQCNV